MWGRSLTNAGVVGKSTSSNGVYGVTDAAHTATTAGVYGASQGEGGIGVFGDAPNGNSWGVHGVTGAGVGVHGEATGSGVGVAGASAQGNAVSGVANSPRGAGVYAANPGLGFAMRADGNVAQSRDSNGWVKAMALINADGTVARCYNSDISSGVSAIAPCGISVAYLGSGKYEVTFTSQIDDRFILTTPFTFDRTVTSSVDRFSSPRSVRILTRLSYVEIGAFTQAPFFIFVF